MIGFEHGSSGIRSDHAVNCATTTAPLSPVLMMVHSHVWALHAVCCGVVYIKKSLFTFPNGPT